MTTSPAPWRYVPKSGQIVDANNRQIARVWHTSNHERDHANGELIAMAPTLKLDRLMDKDLSNEALLQSTVHELHAALGLCVKAIENLLPGARHIVADIGLINDALCAAQPLLEEVHDPTT